MALLDGTEPWRLFFIFIRFNIIIINIKPKFEFDWYKLGVFVLHSNYDQNHPLSYVWGTNFFRTPTLIIYYENFFISMGLDTKNWMRK